MTSIGKPVAPTTMTGWGFVSNGQSLTVTTPESVGAVLPASNLSGAGPPSGAVGFGLLGSKPVIRAALSNGSNCDVEQAFKISSLVVGLQRKHPRPPKPVGSLQPASPPPASCSEPSSPPLS